MDEAEELVWLSARALVAQMCGAPGFELHMVRNCVLGLTDEPSADFNMLCLGPNPEVEGFFARSVARAKARGLPLVAIMSPHVADTLASVAIGLGLAPVGKVPLMVLRGGPPVQARRRLRVTRALGPELVAVAGDLLAAAFDAPRDVVARCIDVGITATAGVETYIGWDGETPMSAVTVTPLGDAAGISAMSTPPEFQRQGAGRALLAHVIDDFRGRGVGRFFLGATEAGYPLYASMGFETVAHQSAWILEG